MAASDRWEKKNSIPNDVFRSIDLNVLAELPEGCTVTNMTQKGFSFWTKTAEIETVDSNGETIKYFLKLSAGDVGNGMVRGEFQSMSALYQALPSLVPKPIAWGTCESFPDVHFFLCAFLDMENEVPGEELATQLAKLHANGASPNGKFGFPVTTYQGNLPQDNTECDTWEECFSRGMANFFKMEEETQGYDEEMVELRKAIMEKVIPRLLRPLESNGRKVVPTLVHGDLWDGNTAVLNSTGQPIIFDACCSYGHNEYDLAPWKPERHDLGEDHVKAYIDAYYKKAGADLVDDDFQDRLELYCLFNLCSAALYRNAPHWRELVKGQMQVLVAKFPLGYEGLIAAQKALENKDLAPGPQPGPVVGADARAGNPSSDPNTVKTEVIPVAGY